MSTIEKILVVLAVLVALTSGIMLAHEMCYQDGVAARIERKLAE